jgi:hypothetical protein
LDFNYYLKNIENRIESGLFQIIENHYDKLHLFERMKLKSIEHKSELENQIRAFKKELPIKDIVSILIQVAESNKDSYGHNHWKSVLEIALLQNPKFITKCLTI